MTITFRSFSASLLCALVAGLGGAGCGAADPAQQAEPANVVLILVDDMGFDDLGCFGGVGRLTPHIDSLASDGVAFDRTYVTASICSPSRAGILTGRYQQRFGHENNTGPVQRQLELGIGLPPGERLLSERLKSAGYATGLVGKWHLGADDAFHPLERGFEEFFGHLSGGHTYIDWVDPKNGPIYRGRKAETEGEYLTDAFSTEAVAFIDRHHSQPFFLFLSYNAMHEPFEAPQAYLDRHAGIADESERVYAAMVTALDEGIGRVLGALDQHGLRDRTLVCFLSDNGPRRGKPGEAAAGLRGGKLSLYEGGLRVPMLLRWPARVAPGRRIQVPVSSLDVVPTSLAAAGLGAVKELDGRSLLPLADGLGEPSPRTLFWRQGGKAAVSDGRYKLVRRAGGVFEAYDLKSDPGEENALGEPGATSATGKAFAKLRTALDAWEGELPPPSWDWSDTADGARSGR